jgi:hypothetical protein
MGDLEEDEDFEAFE